MRIAYLINQYPKVSHTFIRREILALERHGFEIMRISIRGWANDLVDHADIEERKRTRYVLQSGWFAIAAAVLVCCVQRPARLLRALVLAIRLGWRAERSLPFHLIYLAEACLILDWLQKRGVQHVHAHFGTNPAEVAALVHELGGPPFSFTVHGPEEFDKAQFIGLPEKIRRARFVIAVSSFGRSQLLRLVDHHEWRKISVVRCGLEPEFFSAPPNYSHAPHLVCVGRLCEQKGQLLLLDAAKGLADSGVDYTLTLVGDGELRAAIEALVSEYRLQTRVNITGWVSSDEVRRHIFQARALVMPSFAEGLPVAIMEAMALRRPVISTLIAGIPELVRDGENGWLVPSGDVDALVGALKTCLAAPSDVLQRMSDAAFKQVCRCHDLESEAERLATLFNQQTGALSGFENRSLSSSVSKMLGIPRTNVTPSSPMQEAEDVGTSRQVR
jgi:colanic acid/amylovoran biosynthesis glycosyltransferase